MLPLRLAEIKKVLLYYYFVSDLIFFIILYYIVYLFYLFLNWLKLRTVALATSRNGKQNSIYFILS